jgi:hypothetical protein
LQGAFAALLGGCWENAGEMWWFKMVEYGLMMFNGDFLGFCFLLTNNSFHGIASAIESVIHFPTFKGQALVTLEYLLVHMDR